MLFCFERDSGADMYIYLFMNPSPNIFFTKSLQSEIVYASFYGRTIFLRPHMIAIQFLFYLSKSIMSIVL